MSVAQRLRAEIEAWGSIRRFSEQLGKVNPRLKGTSHTTVHKYLKGTVVPKRQWIIAASEMLRVTPEWLETGRGFRTWAADDASVVPDEALGWPDRGRIAASKELRNRIQRALNGLPRLPYQAETPLISFLQFLYVRKGPAALGGSFEGRWFQVFKDKIGADVGVTADQLRDYMKAEFGPVLTDEGREWERVALTFTLLGSLYLREFATVR